jgi:phospholipid/cholesterol/gamma-HCH transport system substrate-binding protein
MGAILTDIESGKSRVGQFVMGTQLYGDIRRRVADVEGAIRSAASTTTELGQQMYTDKLYRRVTAPVIALDASLARLQSGQGAGRFLTDTADYDKAASLIRDLRATIDGLRRSDMVQSDALYVDLGKMVAAWTQSVDQFNAGPVFAAPQTYESLSGAAREMEIFLRDFRGNPRKYMRMKVF